MPDVKDFNFGKEYVELAFNSLTPDGYRKITIYSKSMAKAILNDPAYNLTYDKVKSKYGAFISEDDFNALKTSYTYTNTDVVTGVFNVIGLLVVGIQPASKVKEFITESSVPTLEELKELNKDGYLIRKL